MLVRSELKGQVRGLCNKPMHATHTIHVHGLVPRLVYVLFVLIGVIVYGCC